MKLEKTLVKIVLAHISNEKHLNHNKDEKDLLLLRNKVESEWFELELGVI